MRALFPSLRGRLAPALSVGFAYLLALGCGSDQASNSQPDLEWANWPVAADAPAASAYSMTRDTVTDSVTGLVWQRNAPAATYSWADATTYCDGLSLAGNSDWHLPTLIELESIVNYGKYNPAIDTTIFPATPATASFLTSSPPGNASTNESPLRAVNFYAGSSQVGDPTIGGQVRCVRPGAIVAGLPAGAPRGRYTVNTDSVVDVKTSLTWQRNASTAQYNWTEAATYCQALATGGTGWRLPTVKELQSLVDVRSHQPAIDASAFPGTKPQPFWSSSSAYAGSATAAWAVDFGSGDSSAESNDASHPYQVRCVR